MELVLTNRINVFLEEGEKLCKIKFAYIFGSYARGEENKISDIDIAIMPNLKDTNRKDEVFLRGNLIELGRAIFKKDVDIVFLNTDSVFLKYKIIREGIVIKDHKARIPFESLVFRQYFDFKYYSDYYNKQITKAREGEGEYGK